MELEKFKIEFKKVDDFLGEELAGLRIGRATPALVENITVDYYGTKTPIKQIASISAPEPRVLVIEPWDKNALPGIEKAILASNLGLNPIVDKNIIRIAIPQLTEERRISLIKVVGVKFEEAKIKCRGKRDEMIKEINDAFSAKKINEDDKFKLKEKAEEMVKEIGMRLEDRVKQKEKEIRET